MSSEPCVLDMCQATRRTQDQSTHNTPHSRFAPSTVDWRSGHPSLSKWKNINGEHLCFDKLWHFEMKWWMGKIWNVWKTSGKSKEKKNLADLPVFARRLHIMALSTCIVCGLLLQDKHRKLLLLFCCLRSEGSVEMPLGRCRAAQLAEKPRSQNRFLWSRKRIVLSPAPHCIRHTQQTPSLQKPPPVVFVCASWPHRVPNSHCSLTFQEKWIIYTSFSAVSLYYISNNLYLSVFSFNF